ncbi:S26 family signal peptidase [Haloarcula sp. CBA1130]|uniref:S26 family signal peptidase n=1 Tax=unclassified Haloarcula TaxID=2624677 RepID=UPI001245035A|nr:MULTISPECIES: S26 family signal peptidase [unclassified Haloarcula]KAA9399420.1 S26 family signal peptidase [Haloarcula sp. CBA1129]KAA9403935.1 S26 family signal peptidase [Haloarcula sp. CBA1130]
MGRDESTSSTPPDRTEESVEAGPAFRFGLYVRDIATSVGAVLLVGAFLFAVSGVWPPLVAIESGSMEPHIDTGDMVFVMDAERFSGQETRHGVVTAAAGAETGYRTFQQSGDVIVFEPNGNEQRTPIIHRSMLWVDAGENWYGRANQTYIGSADSCDELRNCPAPHAGFITKGDNKVTNTRYDQVTGASTVVRPEWVIGTGTFRIPRLGYVRVQPAQLSHTAVSVLAAETSVPAAS